MAYAAGAKRVPVVAAALVLLLGVDLWLGCGQLLQKFPTATLVRGEAYNAAQTYRAQKHAPDVVLLGSSLMTAPVMQGEANYLNQPIARFTHRRISALEHLLNQSSGNQRQVFCLAVAGEMASDAAVIVEHLFSKNLRPALIVWGVAPRDFQDNLMPGIDSSETFQVLSTVNDLPRLWRTSNFALDRKFNDLLGRLSSLIRYRGDLRVYCALRTKKLLEAVFPCVVFDKYGETLELKPRKKGQFPEEAKGVLRAFPGAALDHLSRNKTASEYQRRYNPPSPQQIEAQWQYFNTVLAHCRKQGIAVLIVNMPLSRSNKSLMPAGFYSNFRQRLALQCAQNQVKLVDLNTPAWDNDDNFVDGVHLAPPVSERFLAALSGVMSQSAQMLSLHGNRQLGSNGAPYN